MYYIHYKLIKSFYIVASIIAIINMHKIFTLIISLCCSVSILAQTLNLSGSVKDADNGQVLPGATILVEGSSNGTTTDFDGNFNIVVGLGETFQIWDPKIFEKFKTVARKKAYQNRSNLKWENNKKES